MKKELEERGLVVEDVRLQWRSFFAEDDNASGSCGLEQGHQSYDEARMLMDAKNPEEAGICRQIMEVKVLLKKCRIIEKLMITKAQQPIYSLDTNFESDQESSNDQRERQAKKDQKDVCLIWMPLEQLPEVKTQLEGHEPNLNEEGSEHRRLKQDESIVFIQKAGMEALLNLGWQKITNQQKRDFLTLRKKLDRLRRYIVHEQGKKKNEHRCKLCRMEFVNGRQLGGHMSRKHPGSSSDYANKRMMQMIKKLEKNRRNFFKQKRQ